MHVTIIRADNTVCIDGQAVNVDCSTMMNNHHAVQWHGTEGYIETRTGDNLHRQLLGRGRLARSPYPASHPAGWWKARPSR